MTQNIKRYSVLGMLLAGSVASAQGMGGTKVSGFAAPGFNWTKGTSNGFSLMDGALYISHSADMAEVFVDIPFASTGGTTQAFTVGGAKAQAYVGHKMDMGMNWKLGQFDTTMGYEGNDAVDHMFAMSSPLVGMRPVVHTGFKVGYDFSDMLGVNLMIANSDTNVPNAADRKYDFGARVAGKMDAMKFGIEWLYSEVAASTTRNLFDITAGTKMGAMSADLDVAISKVKNVDTMFGFGLQLGYAVSDMLSVGARGEYMKAGALTATSLTKTFDFTVGPQYMVTKAFTLKADYSLKNEKLDVSGATGTTTHYINVAGIYKF
ncbi:MAG: outer membrane beta-barrel protein [Bdellovibrionales bacterium]|nr:outer membrane beta-barrel protein [Bdellovibrionales bacterium]